MLRVREAIIRGKVTRAGMVSPLRLLWRAMDRGPPHRALGSMNAYSLQGASFLSSWLRVLEEIGPSYRSVRNEPVGMEEMASGFLRRHERGEVRTETVDGPST